MEIRIPHASISGSRLKNDLVNLMAHVPPVLGGVVERGPDMLYDADLDAGQTPPVIFHVKVNAAPDLISFTPQPHLTFRFTLSESYPWDPPRVEYLPLPHSHSRSSISSNSTVEIGDSGGGDAGKGEGEKEGGGVNGGVGGTPAAVAHTPPVSARGSRLEAFLRRHTMKQEDGTLLFTANVLAAPDADTRSCWSRAYNLEVIFYAIRHSLRSDAWEECPFVTPVWFAHRVPQLLRCMPGEQLCILSGASASQGERPFMEDTLVLVDELMVNGGSALSLYGIFDGHGGNQCSSYAVETIEKLIVEEICRVRDRTGSSLDRLPSEEYRRALGTAVRKLDKSFINSCLKFESGVTPRTPLASPKDPPLGPPGSPDAYHSRFQDGMETVGSTALVLLFDGFSRFFCASLGDCRAVLCRDGQAVEISAKEHKASRPDEIARICQQGGYVSGQRAQGKLAVSRALGDANMKGYLQEIPNVVSADPEVTEVCCSETQDEFLVLASDGLWDVMSNADVVAYIKERIGDKAKRQSMDGRQVESICEELVSYAITTKGSKDNVSVIIVLFFDSLKPEVYSSTRNHFKGAKNTMAGSVFHDDFFMAGGIDDDLLALNKKGAPGFSAPWTQGGSQMDLEELLRETDVISESNSGAMQKAEGSAAFADATGGIAADAHAPATAHTHPHLHAHGETDKSRRGSEGVCGGVCVSADLAQTAHGHVMPLPLDGFGLSDRYGTKALGRDTGGCGGGDSGRSGGVNGDTGGGGGRGAFCAERRDTGGARMVEPIAALGMSTRASMSMSIRGGFMPRGSLDMTVPDGADGEEMLGGDVTILSDSEAMRGYNEGGGLFGDTGELIKSGLWQHPGRSAHTHTHTPPPQQPHTHTHTPSLPVLRGASGAKSVFTHAPSTLSPSSSSPPPLLLPTHMGDKGSSPASLASPGSGTDSSPQTPALDALPQIMQMGHTYPPPSARDSLSSRGSSKGSARERTSGMHTAPTQSPR